MDKKTAISEYLRRYHRGKEKAIYSQELQRLFSIDGRNLRRKISSLRQDGVPICSGETGYYYADIRQIIFLQHIWILIFKDEKRILGCRFLICIRLKECI